jgi:hypothetical protein
MCYKIKKEALIYLLLLLVNFVWSQCPTVIVTPTVSNITCSGGVTTYTAACYGSSLTIDWFGPGNIPISSVETGSGPVSSIVSPGHPGIYSIKVKGTNTCVTTKTIQVSASIGVPVFSLLTNNFTACAGSTISLQAINVTTSPLINMPVGYYLGVSTPSSTSSFSNSPVFNVPSGNFYYAVMDQSNLCISYYNLKVSSSSLSPLPINVIVSSNTICNGSSISFTASGANTYTWSNSSNSPLLNIFPTSNTVISLQSTDANMCMVTTTIGVQVNTSCATVWPGDANSDGSVNAQDIFELGLNYNSSGPARTFTSNIFSPQDSPIWTGTVSTGKNKAHVDCNGDGAISIDDTLAIYNNFFQTHTLKPNINNSSPQIIIVPDQANAFANNWNTAGIYLGDNSNSINNIYGTSFEIQFDTSFISINNIYISYVNSFINAANTNINLSKEIRNNQRIYGASVRTDGVNVNGNGRIATLYFKPKNSVLNNSILNMNLINANYINKDANLSLLSTGGVTINVINDVAVKDNQKTDHSFIIYPNPTSQYVLISTTIKEEYKIRITDLKGSLIKEGLLNEIIKIDLQDLKNGVYLIQLLGHKQSFCNKLVVFH